MTYNNDKIVRDESIDILRFIGISLIILVHCGAPNWFWTIREYLKILNCKLIRFIGQNTVWIYLYHIPLVWLPIDLNWALRYVIVYAVSILFFMFQYAIYIKLKDKYGVVKYLVG